MNAVGKIGEFIIQYQYPIEIALLSILAVIVLYALIKAIVKTKKEKNVLSQINSTVSDINNTVSSINNNQAMRAEKEASTLKNNISVSKEIPSVKVSYVVSDDERDHQTTVSIDHEYIAEVAATPEAKATDVKIAEEPEISSPVETSVYDELQNRDAEESIEALINEIDSESIVECKEHSEKSDIPKVYMSRDCAIDKFGNRYTEEQLSEQIK